MNRARVWLRLEEIEARLAAVEKAVTALEQLEAAPDLTYEVEALQEV
jgi:hypothetical protein